MIKWPLPALGGFYLLRDGNVYFVNLWTNSITDDISFKRKVDYYDEINSVRQFGKDKEILRFPCKKYQGIKNYSGIKDTYDLYIADSLRTQLNFSYLIPKDMGIVLKMILNCEAGLAITTAIKIEKKELDERIFELPDYPIEQVDMEKVANGVIKGHK